MPKWNAFPIPLGTCTSFLGWSDLKVHSTEFVREIEFVLIEALGALVLPGSQFSPFGGPAVDFLFWVP